MTRHLAPLLYILPLIFPGAAGANEVHVVSGAGPSTQVVTEFFARFADLPEAAGCVFEVPGRSIKHRGGIAATRDNLFGRTGRPLTPAERGRELAEIPLARIPLAFVADPDAGVRSLTRGQLNAVLAGEIVNWSDLGGADLPIRLVGREPTEAAFMILKQTIPEFLGVEFDLVLLKDHQVVQLLETPDRAGVLAFGARANFQDEFLVEVERFAAGVAVGLIYRLENERNPLVQAVRAYSLTPVWRQATQDLGYLPVVHDVP